MKRISIVLMMLVPLALGACGNAPAATERGFDAAQLELENGGFEETDELPAFGIESDLERQLSDAFVLDEIVEAASIGYEPADGRVYFLHLAWGQLDLASPYFNGGWDTLAARTQPADWSGTFTAADGVSLKVVRIARTEPRVEIVQNGPRVVSFQSQIFGHHDGLPIRIVASPEVADDATAVTLRTASASATWSTRDLAALDVVHDNVNAAGDRLAASALERPRSCPAGFMNGRWIRHNERGGRMNGVWLRETGAVLGHIKGVWGQRQNGEKVFFAKVIDAAGRFLGLVRGTWNEGSYSGVFGPREGEPRGEVRGSFREEGGRGFFRGRWSRSDCQGPDGATAP